jgi:hypothetical protein
MSSVESVRLDVGVPDLAGRRCPPGAVVDLLHEPVGERLRVLRQIEHGVDDVPLAWLLRPLSAQLGEGTFRKVVELPIGAPAGCGPSAAKVR